MPRPQWTVEQCRLYGRKGGSHRKGKKLRSEEFNLGYDAGFKAGRAERKRAGMTEKTKDQDAGLLGNTAGSNPQGLAPRRDPSVEPCGGWPAYEDWPDPTLEMLDDPTFNAIWHAIKTWDINVPNAYAGYCGATGNHVRAILEAVRRSHDEAQDAATGTDCITEQTQRVEP